MASASSEQARAATTAVDRLIAAAMQSSRGIVALDSTNIESNDSSGYPPASIPRGNAKRRYQRASNGPEADAGAGEGSYGGSMSNTLVDISLLETAAVETPAALDSNVAERPRRGHVAGRQHQQRRLVPQRQQLQQQQRRRPPPRFADDSSMSSSMGFMTNSGPSGSASQNFSRRRVAIGRKRHQLISNVASFEAFSTSEAEEDIRTAVDRLMNDVEDDQTTKGGPTHRGELWKLIESFFDAIPFVGIEKGAVGQRQFTQYIRVMSALREGIRACVYDNYDPSVDHRTLIPNFSALDLARQNIVTLEAAVLEAEKAVVQSVQSTKADVVMAFKQLKTREREELRQYLEKREDFKPPKTPKISPFRKYSENKRKGIPGRGTGMGGRGGRAAARWLLGSGGVMSNMKTKKLESKLQAQHIEMRRLEWELTQARLEHAELAAAGEARGKSTLMNSLCDVLDIDNPDQVHADDIVGRVKRMRRKNMERAEELFSMQGKNDPAYRRRMEKLVELLDLTTFESGSIEDEIVLAVERLVRQVKQGGGMVGAGDGGSSGGTGADSAGAGEALKTSARTRFKAVGNLIRQLGNVEREHMHNRSMNARRAALQQKKGAQKASRKEVRRFMKGKGIVSNDVSLHGLLNGVSTDLGSKNVPSGINVNNTLAALYEAKISADKRNDEAGKQRVSLAQYLRTFLVHQYGIKKLAMKQMMGIIKAIKRHRRKVPRLNLFARLVGLEESDEHEYSSLAADYFLIVLVELFRALSVRKVGDSDELELSQMMQDGITKKKMLTQSQMSLALQNVDMGRGDRARVMERVQAGKSWDIDSFLTVVMDCWYEAHHERLDRTAQVFFESDENGDGELTLNEFTTAVRVLEPHCPNDDIVELYDRIAGDDGVIDAEEFAEGVMLLHAHMISQHRRIREARRDTNLRAASVAAALSKGKMKVQGGGSGFSAAVEEERLKLVSPPSPEEEGGGVVVGGGDGRVEAVLPVAGQESLGGHSASSSRSGKSREGTIRRTKKSSVSKRQEVGLGIGF